MSSEQTWKEVVSRSGRVVEDSEGGEGGMDVVMNGGGNSGGGCVVLTNELPVWRARSKLFLLCWVMKSTYRHS